MKPLTPARIDPAAADVLHGERIADPYRWLEDGESAETRAFTKAHNAHTRAVLRALPGRKALRSRIAAIMKIGTLSTPGPRRRKDGSMRYFHTRRKAGQNQPMLYVRDGLAGRDRVLIDPNALATDGTAALDWLHANHDGSRIAYGISRGGDEQSVLRIRDVDTGQDLPDVIDRTRHCSVEWLPDGTGFYYTRYPAKGTVPDAELRYHRRVYFHKLGDDPDKDELVFGQGRDLKDYPSVDLSPNGRWLVITVSQGWNKSEVYLKDRTRKDASWVALAEGKRALFSTSVYDDRILVQTNDGSPRYRVYSVDPAAPAQQTPVIGESADVLSSVVRIGDTLFAMYLRDASSRLRKFALDGAPRGEVALPGIGTLWSVNGLWDGAEAFFGFSSFAMAPSVYRIDVKSGAVALWDRIDAPIKPEDFDVSQVRYPSKDGTPISMFLVHKRGLTKNGDVPTYLTGYGGFNLSMLPSFVQSTYVFLEKGGLLAIPNLRGGGEYGEAWHEAGMLAKKQNVFDDFIAAGEWLVKSGWTRPERLSISGGSNGGLLVGAALVQRPDLFRAVVCAVPLLDMLRYHKFLIAKLWIPEYGSADDPEQFKWLRAYSPYHHVKEGTRYPAVLLTTAESDSRVDPLHARKMAARLQAATASGPDRPVLLRIETKAGHGAGKPVGKLVDELVDRWSFLFWQLGMSAD